MIPSSAAAGLPRATLIEGPQSGAAYLAAKGKHEGVELMNSLMGSHVMQTEFQGSQDGLQAVTAGWLFGM